MLSKTLKRRKKTIAEYSLFERGIYGCLVLFAYASSFSAGVLQPLYRCGRLKL